ncbi:MAG: copper resistance system multicopper oxidase [Aquificaceae bacterium]|nr:MAG: copper resistance system multicopper oxidase [Aquificaceae bacterium]
MKKTTINNNHTINPTRRRFVTGLAIGGAVSSLGLAGCTSIPSAPAKGSLKKKDLSGSKELTGTHFDLSISEQRVNFTGRPRIATAINGTVPGPTLRWKEGETVNLRVTNKLPVTSSIHWHGLILPNKMDGVPGLTFNGIAPGQTFNYRFKVQQSGSYWYHSHSGYQEQTGAHGAIVIDPKTPSSYHYDREHTIFLTDWTDEDPERLYAKLKKLSHYYNFKERTLTDLINEIQANGVAKTWETRKMWNEMRMSQRDISDVTGYTYTFLMNGVTPSQGWKGLFKAGEKVLLRFINGSAMTFFDVRIPGLKMTVVAADGQAIKPVSVDEFRIGVAENYDVIVEPQANQAYTLFAQSIGRSGYARGTLTPDLSMTAAVPKFDPMPLLTHADMGMNMGSMGGMDHGSKGMKGDMGDPGMEVDHSKMDHSKMNMPMNKPMAGMDHSKMNMPMNKSMAGMDHSKMNMPMNKPMAGMDHSKMNMQGNSMAGMDHSKMDMSKSMIKHPKSEYGPHVDMHAMDPQYRLDDPGVGLRNNGRRVLTYADLRNLHPTKDKRKPTREIELHLTGNMSRYMWSIDGIKYADAQPIHLKYGERVRITFVNDTMMNHPMHLHGLWSELETGDPNHMPRKHTVIVQPGSKISYQVTADALGNWAYHCHLLYHMAAMFRKVIVS